MAGARRGPGGSASLRLRESTLPLFAHLAELVGRDRDENAERGTGTSYEAAPPPAVPAEMTRSVPVTASMALLLVTWAGMFGALFVATFFLQRRLGPDPLTTGLRVLPLTALMIIGAPAAAAGVRRFGPRRTAVAGQAGVVLAVVGLSRLSPASSWPETGALFAVLGAGFAAALVTSTGTVVGDAPRGYAGVVGGLKQTAMNVGPVLGIAVVAGLMPLASSAGAAPAEAARAMSGSAMGQALAVAALAALGLVPASALPRR